jgi:hypothetical protein
MCGAAIGCATASASRRTTNPPDAPDRAGQRERRPACGRDGQDRHRRCAGAGDRGPPDSDDYTATGAGTGTTRGDDLLTGEEWDRVFAVNVRRRQHRPLVAPGMARARLRADRVCLVHSLGCVRVARLRRCRLLRERVGVSMRAAPAVVWASAHATESVFTSDGCPSPTRSARMNIAVARRAAVVRTWLNAVHSDR